jgi:hypothetical protein
MEHDTDPVIAVLTRALWSFYFYDSSLFEMRDVFVRAQKIIASAFCFSRGLTLLFGVGFPVVASLEKVSFFF